VLLCGRDDLRRAYELCKREKFDDYVLYWPAPDDPSRIVLTVQQQLRNSVLQPPRPALSAAVAVPARRMAAVERKIFDIAADGIRQVEAAESALSRARDVVAGLLESPGCWLTAGDPGEIADVRERMTAPQHRLTDLHETKIEPALRAASEALDPLRLWVHSLSNALVPQMESTLRLAALAEDARPLVMIVDDDELQRRLLAQVLIEERLELIHAATGIEALRLLGKRRPDLIIMDIDLPEIDGIEVTRRIKALGRFASVPVLMLTGHVEPQLFVDSLQAGASDFVLKPFDGTAIRAAVARLLVNPASEAALASSP
jgi:CheY-like chemotaxis protein